MGDIADMMLDGTLCQVCGGVMEDISENHDMESPGYPRTCAGCKQDEKPKPRRRPRSHPKGEYVLSQSQTRRHACHWPGCVAQVPPALWGCRSHWFKLPKRLRDKIWAAFKPGQEKSMTPSRAYLEAAKEVQEWIQAYIKNKGGSA